MALGPYNIDKTMPVITHLNDMELFIKSTAAEYEKLLHYSKEYNNPLYSDSLSGIKDVSITSWDPHQEGVQTVTYTVSDNASNTVVVTRKLTLINIPEILITTVNPIFNSGVDTGEVHLGITLDYNLSGSSFTGIFNIENTNDALIVNAEFLEGNYIVSENNQISSTSTVEIAADGSVEIVVKLPKNTVSDTYEGVIIPKTKDTISDLAPHIDFSVR